MTGPGVDGPHGSGVGRRSRRLLLMLTVVGAATAIAACGSSSNSSSSGSSSDAASTSSSHGNISAVLINGYLANTWRPVMIRTAQLLVQRSPLNSQISSLKVIETDNTAQSQNAALNNVLLNPPKLVLIDASSPTGSNQTIQRVCQAGVTVVSFDNPVTAPCAWKILVNFQQLGVVYAQWMATVLHGKGLVFLDRGLAGTSTSANFTTAALNVLNKYPGITVKSYYSNFEAGAEQSGVANLVSSNPHVAGIISFAYGAPAEEALEHAGVKPVPLTTFSYNQGMIWCLRNKVPCLLGSSPAYISGEAMRLGVSVINGERKGPPTTVYYQSPFFVSNTTVQPQTSAPVLTVAKYAQPTLNPGITIPLSPPWANLTPSEVLTPPSL
jgi:ribose transport system substrate-binding protein